MLLSVMVKIGMLASAPSKARTAASVKSCEISRARFAPTEGTHCHFTYARRTACEQEIRTR